MTTSDARKRNAERKAAMTPADEIRQAAVKLREMAGAVEDLQRQHWDEQFRPDDLWPEVRDLAVLMDPDLARLLADWLDETAAWAEELPGWVDPQALALVRHINGRTA